MSVKSRCVLVSGSAGFIGSHLVEWLLANDVDVIGVDNFEPASSAAEKRRNLELAMGYRNFRQIEMDCRDTAGMDEALGGRRIDLIIHLAARTNVRLSLRETPSYIEVNIFGTRAMLELARRRGITRFILGSSSSVYGENGRTQLTEEADSGYPKSPYGATKKAGELLCRAYHSRYGISIYVLRFFTVYGPRQRPDLAIRKFSSLLLQNEPVPIFGDGSSVRDYTWIGDIIRGTAAAIACLEEAEGAFEIFNLGSGTPVSLQRLVMLIGEAVGTQPRTIHHPAHPADTWCTWANIEKAGRNLGYKPGTMIEEGIPRFVEWIKGIPIQSL